MIMEDRVRFSLNSKWVSTVASIWIQCTSGSLYTFSIYSEKLKTTQGYDQSTLDRVAVFKDIGGSCGILAGVLYSYVTRDRFGRFGGPCFVHLVGAILCFTGYFLMWAAVTGVIPRPPVAVMCLFMLSAAQSVNFFNTTNVVTGVRNFQNYSGTIVGIIKGFLGLSSAILIQLYETVFYNEPTSFLLMLALLPTINSLLFMWFVRIYDSSDGTEKKHLNSFSVISLMVAGYLMANIILEHMVTFPFPVGVLTFVPLLLLLASPLYFAFLAQQRESGRHSQNENDHLIDDSDKIQIKEDRASYHRLPDQEDPADSRHLPDVVNQETDSIDKQNRELGENLNLLQAMCTVDFWILFLAMACGMGTGLTTVNNLSQIGGSLGYTALATSTFVSLWSIWNFLGRFGAGYISDHFLHTAGWARPIFMVITLGIMSIGYFVIASGLPGALYVGSILVGVCYGAQWSLMPTIISEIFGVLNMGTIFNTVTMANPIGSYIFSVVVVGYIYDKEASGEGKTCRGAYCFMLSFLIMAAATLFGSLAALVLFFRTRRFYSQIILRRLLHSQSE